MRILDCETHPINPQGMDRCYPMDVAWRYPYIPGQIPEAETIQMEAAGEGRFDVLTTQLIERMDTFGIEKAVIMHSTLPLPNTQLKQVVDEHPNRFVAFANFDVHRPTGSPPRDTPEALVALERGLSELGMKGVGEVNLRRFSPERPDEAYQGFIPAFEICQKYRCPIMFHTSFDAGKGSLLYRHPINLEPLAAEFPSVPLIVAHMGKHDVTLFEAALMLARKYPNVYLSTSNAKMEFVERAVDEVGAERLIWGSDWSMQHGILGMRKGFDVHAINLDVVRHANISDRDKALILGENLAGLIDI